MILFGTADIISLFFLFSYDHFIIYSINYIEMCFVNANFSLRKGIYSFRFSNYDDFVFTRTKPSLRNKMTSFSYLLGTFGVTRNLRNRPIDSITLPLGKHCLALLASFASPHVLSTSSRALEEQ